MNKCRVCLCSKNINDMAFRGKKLTLTCLKCSEERRAKDYCEHNTRFHDCTTCNDPIIRRTTSIIHGSRIADKKHNRKCDLDFSWVLEQITTNSNCVYCDIELQYLGSYLPSFATIDRVNDLIGHTKDNCVISCRSCNCSQRKFLHPNYWNIVNTLKHNIK